MISTERESTVYVRVPVSVEWGDLGDIQTQQVAVTAEPDARPSSWVTVDLAANDQHQLWRGQPELVFLGGPVEAESERTADVEHAGAGDYQMFAAVGTVNEWIVERVGVWTVA